VLSELGCRNVVLCGAERVEKSFFTSKVLEPDQVCVVRPLGVPERLCSLPFICTFHSIPVQATFMSALFACAQCEYVESAGAGCHPGAHQ